MLKISLLFYEIYKLHRQITQEFLGLRMRNFQGMVFIRTRKYSAFIQTRLMWLSPVEKDFVETWCKGVMQRSVHTDVFSRNIYTIYDNLVISWLKPIPALCLSTKINLLVSPSTQIILIFEKVSEVHRRHPC